jgi:hypothetical protein
MEMGNFKDGFTAPTARGIGRRRKGRRNLSALNYLVVS